MKEYNQVSYALGVQTAKFNQHVERFKKHAEDSFEAHINTPRQKQNHLSGTMEEVVN
jgi:hypothetical protein